MATNGSQAQGSVSASLPRILLAFTLFLPLITGLLLSWHSMGALDVWLHDQVGQDILAGEGFPRTNTYSYTEPDHPWTNHEWLFQVMVSLLGADPQEPITSGISRWNLLRTFLTAALLGILILGEGSWGRIRRNPGNNPGARCWLSFPLLLGVLLLWPRLTLRPELISFVFFVLLVRALDRPLGQWTPSGSWRDLVFPRRPLGLALWLTIFWSQFHGFSSLGPVVLLLAFFAGLLKTVLPGYKGAQMAFQGRWWLLSLPLLLLGLCLSPNGIQGLIYPLRALGQFQNSAVDLRATISELTPLLETRDSLGYTLLAFQLSLIWGLLWIMFTWGRISILRILLWAVAALAAYHGQRNIGFYGVTFILLHTGDTGMPLWRKLTARLPGLPSPFPGLGAVGLALLVAIPWWGQILSDDFYLAEGVSRRFGSGANPGRYPDHAAHILAQTPGFRLFTNVDAAAFLLDRGQARLFIDGRTEAYSSERWSTYESIKRGDQKAVSLLESSRPEGIYLSSGGGSFHALTRTLLQDPGWRLASYDATGFFFLPGQPGGSSSENSGPGPSFFSFGGDLPERSTALSPARAADLCLAWSIVMELGGNQTLQETALRRGLEFRSDHPQLQHNLGNILLARENHAAALPLFRGALQVNRRLAGSALNAGVCLLRLGEPEKARQMFSQATRINPRSFQAWANLSASCQALGDRAGAIEALEKAASLQPGNQRISNMLRQLRASP